MTSNISLDSVKVRMYRHGFGDCFLLRFFQEDKPHFTMLIDCGIKYNTKSDDAPIEDVLADLAALLTPAGGTRPKLDVLVATHEHWDHISFFHPTRGGNNYFADFDIGQVWLAWTEDPCDEEARTINSRLREGVAALAFAAESLQQRETEEIHQSAQLYGGKKMAMSRQQFNKSLDDVMGFYGATALRRVSESGISYKTNGRVSSLTQQAMEHVVNQMGRNGVKYFQPGTVVDKQLHPQGINIYVLGPPRSSQINKSNPSSGAAHETYMKIDRFGMSSFIEAALAMGAEDGSGVDAQHSLPFRAGVGMHLQQAEQSDFFHQTYFAEDEAYRRIENNWLDITGQFALQLDGAINNTSLVLAIELADSGKVLLFPGDAQVGSWLSWHDYQWEIPDDDCPGHTRKRTAEELLNKTVLYKVSHHGSHNATLKEKGLEMMTHPELVAMVPEKEDSYSGIPYTKLFDRLDQTCKGRVIVSADKNYPPEKLAEQRPAGLTVDEWSSFKDNLEINRVFVEYTIRS